MMRGRRGGSWLDASQWRWSVTRRKIFWRSSSSRREVRGRYQAATGLSWRRFVFRTLDMSTEAAGLAYAAILLLAFQTRTGGRLLAPLAATGRMALTTYLTQSVVCTILFYSYGLGWFGRVGYTGMFRITVTLFAVQMAASVWWLRRYRFGPVEWLWRTLTYGRAPAMRVGAGGPVTNRRVVSILAVAVRR